MRYKTSSGIAIDTRKLHSDDRQLITGGEITGGELQTFIDECYVDYARRGRVIASRVQDRK
jgi:hypothetical protein